MPSTVYLIYFKVNGTNFRGFRSIEKSYIPDEIKVKLSLQHKFSCKRIFIHMLVGQTQN